MKKGLLPLICLIMIHAFVSAQVTKQQKPKLVVGLVIDQMRWDYLYRYQDQYADNGFKRLLRDGFSCENTLIPYVPTYTAPGHTCVYTGSVPAVHGIVGNNWYDAGAGIDMYCTADSTVSTLGSESRQGKMSPKNMLSTTIGDELRISSNFRSKVFGVALKDRGAILPAGHAANAAFWYDDTIGKWISSTYYGDNLPSWLITYNKKNQVDEYMSKDWSTLLPIDRYSNSTADKKDYEGTLPEENEPVFPHRLSQIGKAKYSAFKYTPFAATYTFEMAKEIVKNEKLGGGAATDMLTVSISSTDYMGHTFGPNSLEAEDTYIRLDRDIADFLAFLDQKIGKGQYLFFLTADHAAANAPGYSKENNLPGGAVGSSGLSTIKERVKEVFKMDNLITKMQNNQVYLEYPATGVTSSVKLEIEYFIADLLMQHPDIAMAFPTSQISSTSLPEPVKSMLINGYNFKRSGQVGYILNPGYMGGSKGTTHGSWNPYDSHIPLIWFGTNVKPGKTNRETYMTDIAPTVAALLNIQMPSGNVGHVIGEVTGDK